MSEEKSKDKFEEEKGEEAQHDGVVGVYDNGERVIEVCA